jgi:2-polyprenyl-6-methoxyphenol hydroxylase-like FAD-dependent oxidoreductase
VTEDADILIAGAGIAGLTAALALAQRGIECTVVEAFGKPSEVGAGLQVAPNASRILAELGVLKVLAAKAIAPRSVRLGDALTGKIVLDIPIGHDWVEKMGAPYLAAHRATLHGVLYDAACQHPAITIRTGHSISEVRYDNGSVLTRIDTAKGNVEIRSRILIGADGIWSKVRDAVDGASRPGPTGRVAWRTMLPAGSSDEADVVTAWMAPNSHLLVYPVHNSETRNVVAITSGHSQQGNWAQNADTAALTRLLGHLGNISVAKNLDRATWTTWPLCSGEPGGNWHSGGILLIGDAAHGMEPFAAQGAAMAIEDGYAAALSISENSNNVRTAFASYCARRRERINRVAKRTEFNRWVYHQNGPGRWVRNRFFGLRRPESFLDDLDWLYGYNVS